MPFGRIRTPRGNRAERTAAGRWLAPVGTGSRFRRSWLPLPATVIRDHVPASPESGQTTLRDWNREYARRAILAKRLQAERSVGVCIATDDPTGTRPAGVLTRLNTLAPAHLSFHAVVVTGSAAVEEAMRGIDWGACGAVRSLAVLRDPSPFLFARRVNEGVQQLIGRHPLMDSVLLANDDTAPSALACARMAMWPAQNCLVGAVSNEGGGGIQNSTGFWEQCDCPDGTDLVESPHRLCGFFLYASVNAWLALGGFDEEYAGYGCDDTDFSIRAHARGVRLLVDPLAFVWHRGGITYRGDDVECLRQQARATFREKNPGLPPYTVPFPLPGS